MTHTTHQSEDSDDLTIAYLRSITHPDWLEVCRPTDEGAFPVYAAPVQAVQPPSAIQHGQVGDDDGPIGHGWQITVADGHSGYGVYAHLSVYPEEGSLFLMPIHAQAAQERDAALHMALRALRALHDEQEDAPLESRRQQWRAAMEQAQLVLSAHEESEARLTDEQADSIHRRPMVRTALLAYRDRPADFEAREVVREVLAALHQPSERQGDGKATASDDAADARRYRAFFENGLPVTFQGVDHYSKESCDAAIDASQEPRDA